MTISISNLSLPTAQLLVSRAIEEARQEFKRPVCVAVCDSQGFLIALGRADGSPVRSVAICQGKAYSAVRMGVSTGAFLARVQKENIEVGFFCDPALTALPGGSVLKNAAGDAIGGIGVSGLLSAEDQVITDRVAELLAAGKLAAATSR